ncbi:MAG: hypothetical protein ACOX4Z_11560 [Desulfobulbus sp.]|jgi:hypothetical protein
MEQLVTELKRLLNFKDETGEGDIVVVAAQDPQLLVYAVVGTIERDQSRRDEWWHVTFHLLGMPIQSVIWTLREAQFTGKEIFTIGGNPHFIKAIVLPAEPEPEAGGQDPQPEKKTHTRKLTRIK